MALIDVKMLADTMKWSERECSEYQHIRYINSRDRSVTDASIRRFMYEFYREDDLGECYTAYFSAANFHRNMRKYFTEIAKLYRCNTNKADDISDIIESIPPTAGWITLIINDIDALADKPEILSEIMTAVTNFAAKNANIILIGNGSYREILGDVSDAMIGTYDQEADFEAEDECFESEKDRNKALNFYWKIILEQIGYEYFDYTAFKKIFTETLAFLIPNVTEDHVNRSALDLICIVKKFGEIKTEGIDGCKIWELDAARQFASELYSAISNSDGHNDNFSDGKLLIYVRVDEKPEIHEFFVFTEATISHVWLTPDNCSSEMDDLADNIRIDTYCGE